MFEYRLVKQFRLALKQYLNNPSEERYQQNLIRASKKIYLQSIKKSSYDAGENSFIMEHMIRNAVAGLRLTVDDKQSLDAFIRRLGCPEEDTETQAFHALSIAYNLFLAPNSEECVRQIEYEFSEMLNKLKKQLVAAKRPGRWFVSQEDVARIQAKSTLLKELYTGLVESIRSRVPKKNDANSTDESLLDAIRRLKESDCIDILTLLRQNIEPLIQSTIDSQDEAAIKNYSKLDTLKKHTLDDQLFFSFLDKLVQMITEAIGWKSSEEQLVEEIINKATLTN